MLNAENLSQPKETDTSGDWDFHSIPFRGGKKIESNLGETTVGSTIKNATERAATAIGKASDEFQLEKAEQKSYELEAAIQDQIDALDKRKKNYGGAVVNYYDRQFQNFDAKVAKATAANNLSEAREQRNTTRQAARFDTYIGQQANQIGSVLKAGGGVVKNALRSFKASFIAKLPKIKIEITNNDKIANQNWQEGIHEMSQERRDAKSSVRQAETARSDFGQSINSLRDQFNKFGVNRETFRENISAAAAARAELKTARTEQKDAKKAYKESSAEFRHAKSKLETARRHYESAEKNLESTRNKKEAIDNRAAKLQERVESAEDIIDIQLQLGNRSPESVKADIDKKRAGLEEKLHDKKQILALSEKIDKLLGIYNEDAVNDVGVQRVENQIARLDAQSEMIDKYLENRQQRVEAISTKAKPAIRNTFNVARQKAAALIAAIL